MNDISFHVKESLSRESFWSNIVMELIQAGERPQRSQPWRFVEQFRATVRVATVGLRGLSLWIAGRDARGSFDWPYKAGRTIAEWQHTINRKQKGAR
jgi:hypothetical protein